MIESFEQLEFPAMRFIGKEGADFDDAERCGAMRVLDGMREYGSGFDHDVLFMHHNGLSAENRLYSVWGRFMRADALVPDGFVSIALTPHYIHGAGPPYLSRFAFAVFSGDADAMHTAEGYECDAMYDFTRNAVLSGGVNIPYPEKFWTAEVFFDDCGDKAGYLFSTCD